MSADDRHRSHISGEAIEEMEEVHIRHPLNPDSDVYLRRLAPVLGLERLALYVARIPPGKESFAYHRHECDEEFLLILSGRGQAEIDGEITEVKAGDLMGFPAPDGPPHHLTNPFDEDLVYLMGGESSDLDIAHFPKLGQHLVFSKTGIRLYDDKEGRSLTFSDWLAE